MPVDRSLTRRVLGWTGAVGAMALLIVGMASMKNGPDERDVAPPPPPVPQLVAVVDGDVVLLNPDGGIARTIASGDADDVIASPDGRHAYFTRSGVGRCAPHEIVRVPIGGGAEEVVATGSQPRISPDGRTLAYLDASSMRSSCPPPEFLTVLDLESGDRHSWIELLDDSGQVTDYEPPMSVDPVTWAPDALLLAVELEYRGGSTEVIALNTSGRTDFLAADSASLALASGVRPVAYRSDGTMVVVDDEAVVIADPLTGTGEQTLFQAEAPVRQAWSDGERVAFTVRGSDDLHVWHPDDEVFRIVPVAVESAAWLP